MPNHTTNHLELNGISKDINAFIKLVSTKDSLFDFNKIIALPDELVDTVSSWGGEELTEEQQKEKDNRDKELIKKYGSKDWYGWQCANWGTKWNAYDFSEKWEKSNGFASLVFYTAWSSPVQLLVNASKKFPKIVFTNSYSDEGGFFVGKMIIENGEIVEHFLPDWFSQEGIKLRQNLGSYYDEDEYEIEHRAEYILNNPEDMTKEEKQKAKKVKKPSKKKSIKKK